MFESFKSKIRSRQRRKWEKRRRRGKRSFIIRRGVLRWGGIVGFLTVFAHFCTCHGKPDWWFVLSALIACPFAGYLWAWSIWLVNEARFPGARKQQNSSKSE
jgi:hypothetical protein